MRRGSAKPTCSPWRLFRLRRLRLRASRELNWICSTNAGLSGVPFLTREKHQTGLLRYGPRSDLAELGSRLLEPERHVHRAEFLGGRGQLRSSFLLRSDVLVESTEPQMAAPCHRPRPQPLGDRQSQPIILLGLGDVRGIAAPLDFREETKRQRLMAY